MIRLEHIPKKTLISIQKMTRSSSEVLRKLYKNYFKHSITPIFPESKGKVLPIVREDQNGLFAA